jgi:MazG family protein
MDLDEAAKAFREFVEVVKSLRTPGTGCPWDLEQTHQTLRPYLVEEAYEALDAIDRGDDRAMREELGDLLLQVVLHAQLADDRTAFSIAEVVRGITEKMVRRHPHVFGSERVSGSAEVLHNWERIKAAEQQAAGKAASADPLARVPESLPALLRAQRLAEKAARTQPDEGAPAAVLSRLRQHLDRLEGELRALTEQGGEGCPSAAEVARRVPEDSRGRFAQGLGEVLFDLCELARWLGVTAEDSLRSYSRTFVERFRAAGERTAPAPAPAPAASEPGAAREYVLGQSARAARRLEVQDAHFAEESERLLDELALRPHDRVVELGCGPGGLSRRILRRLGAGGVLVGVDRSEGLLAQARAALAALEGPARFEPVLGDIAEMGGWLGGADVVVARTVLHHLPMAEFFLGRLRAALRPGTRVGFLEPDFRTPLARLAYLEEGRPELAPLRVWATAINQLYEASRLSPDVGATLARALGLAGYRAVRAGWAECRTDGMTLENMEMFYDEVLERLAELGILTRAESARQQALLRELPAEGLPPVWGVYRVVCEV